MIAEGRGNELILLPGWWYIISADSYIDRLTTMPDTVETASQVNCPVLYIRGDQELQEAYPAEEFAAKCGGQWDVEIIKGCDHFYNGREEVIMELIVSWLQKVLLP